MRRRSAAVAAAFARGVGPGDAAAILSTARSPHRHAGGDLAVRHGDELERWLEAQHARAIARGLLARMRHVGPPHRRTGPGGTEIRIVGLGPWTASWRVGGGGS